MQQNFLGKLKENVNTKFYANTNFLSLSDSFQYTISSSSLPILKFGLYDLFSALLFMYSLNVRQILICMSILCVCFATQCNFIFMQFRFLVLSFSSYFSKPIPFISFLCKIPAFLCF